MKTALGSKLLTSATKYLGPLSCIRSKHSSSHLVALFTEMLVVITIAGDKRFGLVDAEHTCKCKYKVILAHTMKAHGQLRSYS